MNPPTFFTLPVAGEISCRGGQNRAAVSTPGNQKIKKGGKAPSGETGWGEGMRVVIENLEKVDAKVRKFVKRGIISNMNEPCEKKRIMVATYDGRYWIYDYQKTSPNSYTVTIVGWTDNQGRSEIWKTHLPVPRSQL